MEMEDDSTKRKEKKQRKWVGSQHYLLSTHFSFFKSKFTLFYMVLHIVKNFENAYVLYLHFNNLDGIK